MTLVSVRINLKPGTSLYITNRQNDLSLGSPLFLEDDSLYLFNQPLMLREARPHKKHLQLLVNAVNQAKQQNYIAAAIVLELSKLAADQ